MSGIAHAVNKVFKSVVGVVKKIWKPLVIAAAVYFTGGAALGALGGLSAGGGLAGAASGALEGLGAAAGGIGIGSGAGIGAAFDAGAGAVGAGGALMGAPALGAGGELVDAGGGLIDASGASLAGAPASLAGGDAAATGGFETLGGSGITSGSGGDLSGQLANPSVSDIPAATTNALPSSVGQVGAPSSMWGNSLSIAGKIMTTPGMPSLIGGILNGYEQGKMIDAQQKWADAHAPGQIAGGASGAWGKPGTFPMNQNLQPNTPMPTTAKLPALQPYTQSSPQMPGVQMPGYGQPGSNSARYPGYGTPGYGQQPPYMGGVLPGQESQYGLLSQTPYMDSPYDQSYV